MGTMLYNYLMVPKRKSRQVWLLMSGERIMIHWTGIIGQVLSSRGMSLATMEDFTGGLLGHIITESTLSSQFYRGGIIANSDLTQIGLGIPAVLIEDNGGVSVQVAEAMAVSIKRNFPQTSD